MGHYQHRVCKLTDILICNYFSSGIPFIQMTQLDAQKRRLEFIQSGIKSLQLIMVFYSGTIVSQNTNLLCEFYIIGSNCSSVTNCSKIFTGVKTKSCGIA